MKTHFPYLLDPTKYSDFTRRQIRVPTWNTFGGKPQSVILRVFSQRNGKLVDWLNDLDLYCG